MPARWKRMSALMVFGFVCIRLALIGQTGLGDSESYYWMWAQHLDWSYYDHPPMTAWLMALFTAIGGDHPFVVRLPSVLLFLATNYVVYLIAKRLFQEEKSAFYALLIFNLCPITAIGALQMVPDVPAALCWLLYVYFVVRLIDEDNSLWWYPAGAVLGLGLLGKYMLVPLIPATLLMLAAHPDLRRHFKTPHLYLGGLLGLLCLAPVMVWNARHHYASFRFHLSDRHHFETPFAWAHMGEFLGGQLLYLSPLMWFGLLFVACVVAGYVWCRDDRRFRVLFWFGLPPLAFFMLIGLWTDESEPHWTAFGYLTLFIAWGYLYTRRSQPFRNFTALSMAVSTVLILTFYIHLFVPILPLKPKYDIVNEMHGWDTIAPKIDQMMQTLPVHEANFILSHHWILSSQIAFATQNRYPVFAVSDKVDQYDFFARPQPVIGANFIYVDESRFNDPPGQYYKFDHVAEPVAIDLYRGTRWIRTVRLYKGFGYRGDKGN